MKKTVYNIRESITVQEAKRYIENSNCYAGSYLVGAYLLVKRIYENNKLSDSGIEIDNLENVLQQLPQNQYITIRMRFWKGKTLQEIGDELRVSKECARLYEEKALGFIKKNLFLFYKDSRLERQEFLNECLKGESSKEQIKIEQLRIPEGTVQLLKKAGVNTLGDIYTLTQYEFKLKVKGVGDVHLKEIQKEMDFWNVSFGENVKKEDGIERLGILSRYCNQLHKGGIYKISQIYNWSQMDYDLFGFLTEKGKLHIQAKLKEVFPTWQINNDFQSENKDNLKIHYLYLQPRYQKALLSNGIDTIAKLKACSQEELLLIRGIGLAGVKRIQTELKIFNDDKLSH